MINSEFDEIFEGELSDVDENCRGCKKLNRILKYKRHRKIALPELDFKEINQDTLEATISLLIQYRLYDTLAELISSGTVQVDDIEIPSVVKIKIRKQKNSGKNIHEIFYKELEREIGMSVERKQEINWIILYSNTLNFVFGCFKQGCRYCMKMTNFFKEWFHLIFLIFLVIWLFKILNIWSSAWSIESDSNYLMSVRKLFFFRPYKVN